MDLKQLRLLCALGDTGHFKKAADACFISQPALSMRLKALEEELGVPLVVRKQRFEGFTPEGEHLLAYARNVVASCDAIKSEANALQGQVVGTVRLGMVPLSDFNLAQRLDPLLQQHPQLRFEIQSQSNETILEQLANNKLDVGIVYAQAVNTQHFELSPLGEQRCQLLYHPLHFRDSEVLSDTPHALSWQQVSTLPLSLLTGSNYFRQFLDKEMLAQGLTLKPVVETDSVHQLLQLVDSGLSATIIPGDQLAGMAHRQLKVIPITPYCSAPGLGLVMKKSEPAPVVPRVVYQGLATADVPSSPEKPKADRPA